MGLLVCGLINSFVDVVTSILKAAEQLTTRLPETAEAIMMELSKTPEVPLIETTDAVLTSTRPQLSVISKSTPSSPPVSEEKEVFLALEKGEQALRYDFDWDDLPPVENYKDDSPATTTGGADQPSLTVQEVKNEWENVMKRVKQRKQSATTAAMLRFYDIVGVEGTTEQVVISIQAQKQGYYSYVNDQERYKDLEWALTTEFGQKCRVRLLPPGAPLDHSV